MTRWRSGSSRAASPAGSRPATASRTSSMTRRRSSASKNAADRRLAEIEMAGEEASLGFEPASLPRLSPEVRYLHVSRTIHQLITDRNRSVGIFLFVASVLSGASTALLNVRPEVAPIIPLA